MKKRTLAEVDPDERGISYARWKANELNKLFKEYGALKQPGKIQLWAVEDGLKKRSANRAVSEEA